jgi:5-methylcytosine-specific restriction endonuclease McrA
MAGTSPVATANPTEAAPHQANERILVKYALRPTTQAKVDYARQLFGHAVPSGDVDQVLDRALDLLIAQLEKRKFAATTRPRPRPRVRTRTRSIPANVKRAVWQRDGAQCTFVAATGHRCVARHRLEYDHIEPFALGGASTLDGLRLRCRAHNQYEAERQFGSAFMIAKREAAKREAAKREAAKREAAKRAAEDRRQAAVAG